MKLFGLSSQIRRKHKYSSYQGEVGKKADNLIQRQFEAANPMEKCYTDVTEFAIPNSTHKLYLSPVLDGFNSEIIAYNLSTSPNLEQVKSMLDQSFTEEHYENTILHSDQGWQYQHQYYHQFLEDKGIQPSMSRKGNSPDNGMMESFFGILKSEMFYGYEKTFHSLEQLEQAIVDYIDYYNNKHIKVKLKGLGPVQYRTKSWKGYNKLDTKLREIVERFIMARRKFDKQFKNSAVKLILEEGYSVKEVSQELEVHANSLYRWVQEVEEYGESAFPGNGTALANAQHKIKLLEKENRYLQEELELLKKFRVFLKRSK
ncbi:transposase [Streptococcus thermophilus]|nr:transposase [Streptococcus thermophilus]